MPSPVATSISQEWWLVQKLDGSIGLVQGPPPTNTVSSIYVATAANLQDLMNNHAQALGNAQSRLFGLKGISTKQIDTFIAQLDAGAGAHNTTTSSGTFLGLTSLFVGPDSSGNQVTSNEPTNLTGDAQPVTSTPSVTSALGAISDIWSFLTQGSTWVRVLEYVGGAILLYLGIKGLAG